MLEALFGSRTSEQVLLYLECYGEGYAREIARIYDVGVSQVYKQLKKLEDGGLLVSREFGRTRVFEWNPRNPLVTPLRELLRQALNALPPTEIDRYYRGRRRPRKSGKPLRPA